MPAFSDLPHATRFAMREIIELHEARIETYADDCVVLTMKPSADKKGWSAKALDLHHLMLSLGFERIAPGWNDPCTVPNDPYANCRGCYFTARYRPTRDPLPSCSTMSK